MVRRQLILIPTVGTTLLAFVLSGCSRSEGHDDKNTQAQDEKLQQEVADATQKAKEEANRLNQEADAEAQRLKQQAQAVKEGVKEGWNRSNNSQEGLIDVNSASQEELERLPGVSPADARRIVRGRPYNSPRELLTRRILSDQQYEALKASITVR